MGIELELGAVILTQIFSHGIFGRFEGETPATKKILKRLIIDSVIVGLYYRIGHYAILVLVAILAIGLPIHINACKKHGIDRIKATPRKKYYQRMGWKREE